jgi:hypothetical protein
LAAPAPVMNHLRPWTTHLPPFFSARVSIIVGSEPEPGMGSVMAKADCTSPSMIGCSQRSFCSSDSTLFSAIMVPSSGAAQLKHMGPNMERPISS